MSNKYFVGKSAKDINISKALLPYTKVVVIAGEDENGNQLVYEAGNATGRTLEVTNPWGTQQIANDMLAKIQGFVYKPFSTQDSFIPDNVELGDGITIGGIYSTLVSQDITFDSLCTSNIEASGADETENEFGIYADSTQKDLKRKVNTITTKFTVELGKIETQITNEVDGLETLISQTQDDILLSVKGDYASEWETGTTYYVDDVVKVTTISGGKVTAVNFYKCINEHMSINSRKPPNSTYWTSVSAPTVQSMIDMSLDGISISYDNSGISGHNQAYIKLNRDGVEIGGGTVTMGNVVADSVEATNITTVNGKIQTAQIEELVVGGNVTMGQNARISWSHVDDQPTILDDTDVTTITETTIQTTTVTAQNLNVNAANVSGTLNSASLVLGGLLEVKPRSVGSTVGYVGGITGLQSGTGSCIADSDINSLVIVTSQAAQLKFVDPDKRIWVASGGCYSNETMQVFSDRNLKHDINYDLSEYEKLFDSLKPCSYVYNSDQKEQKRFGMIAQDVRSSIAKYGMQDDKLALLGIVQSEDGSEDTYTLAYGELIAILVKEVQKLKKQVKELTA